LWFYLCKIINKNIFDIDCFITNYGVQRISNTNTEAINFNQKKPADAYKSYACRFFEWKNNNLYNISCDWDKNKPVIH